MFASLNLLQFLRTFGVLVKTGLTFYPRPFLFGVIVKKRFTILFYLNSFNKYVKLSNTILHIIVRPVHLTSVPLRRDLFSAF